MLNTFKPLDFPMSQVLLISLSRYRQVRELVQGHTAGKWWDQDLNAGLLIQEAGLQVTLEAHPFSGEHVTGAPSRGTWDKKHLRLSRGRVCVDSQ